MATVVLDREVTGAADVSEVIDSIEYTIRSGHVNNLSLGDFFGIASINIPAGHTAAPAARGAFSEANTAVHEAGRSLDFVLVSINPYLDRMDRSHVIFHSRHVLSAMAPGGASNGYFFQTTATASRGYIDSELRLFVINNVTPALTAAGIAESRLLAIPRALGHLGAPTETSVVQDRVFIPSVRELTASNEGHTHPELPQRHFHFYASMDSRAKFRNGIGGVIHWTATPHTMGLMGYMGIAHNGNFDFQTTWAPTEAMGVAPAFAIG